jgi:hypothetical protein
MEELSDYNNFWYTFDNKFNGGFFKVDEHLKPISINGELQRIVDKDYRKKVQTVMSQSATSFNASYDRSTGTLDVSTLQSKIGNIIPLLLELSDDQLDIIEYQFQGSEEKEQLAFEYFGQGVLYDMHHDSDRVGYRIPDPTEFVPYRVHKVDEDGLYVMWYMVIRAAIAAGALETRWLKISRLVALAFLINSIVKPRQSFDFLNGSGPEYIPANQKMSWRESNKDLLQGLRDRIRNASLNELDSIFMG